MAIVGNATVVVRARVQEFKNDLKRAFTGAERDADASGASSGSRFGRAFSSGASRGVDPNTLLRRLVRDIEGAGDSSGLNFGQRFGRRVEDSMGPGIARSMDGIIRRAGIAGSHSGDGFFSSFLRRSERGFKDFESQADSAGNGISRSFLNISFGAPDIGGQLLVKIAAIIPLVGVLGGALAALVGALTAVAAAAAFAAGSLAIIATGVVGLIGAVGAGVLAFGGIGKAVSALGAEQASAGKNAISSARQQRAAAQQIEAAQRRLIQARKDLARARVDATRNEADAERRVEDAERRLTEVQRRAADVQKSLTQARIDAAHHLVDLQLSLRGAVLGEEQATLNLQRAQENYQKVLNDPTASNDDKEQARLDLENAELSLDQARQTREDVTSETEKANKAGIEGSAEVVQAKKDINDANRAVADAERDLADARREQAQQVIDDAERIANAQQNVLDAVRSVADAQRDAADATNQMSSSVQKAKSALAGLSPEAQKFARFLFSLKPKIKELREAAGKDLFPALTTSLTTLTTDFFPTLLISMRNMGNALGQFALKLTDAFKVKNFQSNLKDVTKALVPDFAIAGQAAGNFMRGLVGLALAAEPVLRTFLKWIEKITGAFAKRFEGAENIKSASDLLERMGKAAASLGNVIGTTFQIIGDVFRAALPTGLGLVGDMNKSLDNLHKKLASEEGQANLREFFEKIVPPTKAVIRFLGELGKQFLKLGTSKGLADTFDALRDILPRVGKAIETFTTEVVPGFIKVIGDVVDIFQKVVDSGAFKIFATTLGLVFEGVKLFVGVLFADPIKKFTGALLGLAAAWVVLRRALQKMTGIKIDFGGRIKPPVPPPVAAPSSSTRSGGSLFRRSRAPSATAAPDAKATSFGGNLGKLGRQFDTTGAAKDRFIRNLKVLSRTFDTTASGKRRPGGATPVATSTSRRRVAGTPRRPSGSAGSVRPGLAGAVAATAAIGLAIAPALLNGDIKGLKEAVGNIGQTIKDNLTTILLLAGPAIFSKLGAGAAKAGPHIAKGLSKTGNAISSGLGKAFTGLKGPAGGAASSIGSKLGKALGSIGKVAGAASKALFMVGRAMFAALGPVGLIILGITALVAGFIYAYKHSETFRKIVDKVAGALKKFGEFILGTIIKAFQFLKKHLQIVLLAFGPLGIAISAIITVFKHWDEIVKIVGAIIGSVVDFFVKLPGRILSALNGIGARIGNFIRTAFVFIYNVISTAVRSYVDFWIKLPGRIIAALAGIGVRVANFLRGAFVAITSVVGGVITGVVNFFRGLPGRIAAFGGQLLNAARGLASSIGSGIRSGVSAAITFVVGIIAGLPGRVLGLVKSLGAAGRTIGSAIFGGIRAMGGGILDLIKAPLNFMLDGLRAILHYIGGIGFKLPDWLGGKGFHLPDLSGSIHNLAKGATILPRAGGTLAVLAEAGRAETVVDTGLINARLRNDQGGQAATVAELKRIRTLLEQIRALSGITIEAPINIPTAAAPVVARETATALRRLAFELQG